MGENLDALYQEIILEHRKDPRNYRKLERPDLQAEGFNPACGDRVAVELKVQKEAIVETGFQAEGCALCMASASMMTDEIQGLTLSQVLDKISLFRDLMQGKVEADVFEGDLASLAGARKFPVRIKCVLLPWTTLKQAVEKSPGVATTE